MTRYPMYRFHTARFEVIAYAMPEYMDPADSFCEADDIAFASNGDPAHWFCAVVEVRDRENGRVIGCDTLGGCSYNSFEEFVSSHRDPNPDHRNTLAATAQGVVYCHYFPSMIAEAIADARKNIGRTAL